MQAVCEGLCRLLHKFPFICIFYAFPLNWGWGVVHTQQYFVSAELLITLFFVLFLSVWQGEIFVAFMQMICVWSVLV